MVVGTLPDTPHMCIQVLPEALGGCLAFEATEKLPDLRGASVIFSNNAVGALSAFSKGSFPSTFLQQRSMQLCRRQRPLRCSLLYLHAPGRVLVDEGVDDASRSMAKEVAGPVSGPHLRGITVSKSQTCLSSRL